MPSGGGNTTSTTTAQPWEGAQEFLRGAYDIGQQMFQAGPPSYYPGQTVANQSPYTQAAIGLTAERGLGGSPLIGAAQQATGQLASGQTAGSQPFQQAQNTFSNVMAGGANAQAMQDWANNPLAGIASGAQNPAAGMLPAANYGITNAIAGNPVGMGDAQIAGRQLGQYGSGQNSPMNGLMPWANQGVQQAIGGGAIGQGQAGGAAGALAGQSGGNMMAGLMPTAQGAYQGAAMSPGAVSPINYGAMQQGFNQFASGGNNIVGNPLLSQAGNALGNLTGANASGTGLGAATGAASQIASGQAAMTDPAVSGAAQGNLLSNLQGNYLQGNPYLEQAISAATRPAIQNFERTIAPAITGGASGAGRYGSGAMYDELGNAGEALNKQVADTAAQMAFQGYDTERNRQMQSLGLGLQGGQQDIANRMGASGQLFGLYGTDIGAQAGAANALLGAGQGQNALNLNALGNLGQLYQGDRGFGLNVANSGFSNALAGAGQQANAANALLGQYGSQQQLGGNLGLGMLNNAMQGRGQDIGALNSLMGQYQQGSQLGAQAGLGVLGNAMQGGNQQLAAINQIGANAQNATGNALNAADRAQTGALSVGNQQLQASQLAPALAAQDYLDLSMLGNAGAQQDAYNQQLIGADIDRYNYGVNADQTALNQYIAQLNNTPWGQNAVQSGGGPTGLQQGLSAAGGIMSILGPLALFGLCWVAREAYDGDAKWLRMRDWMVNRAPATVRDWYLRNGEKLAAWLHENPEHKPAVRASMDRLIASGA